MQRVRARTAGNHPPRRQTLRIDYDALATAEASGCATEDELAALQAAPDVWVTTLRRLLVETEAALARAHHINGDEREMVLADLSGETRRLADAIGRLTGRTPTLRSEGPARNKPGDPRVQKDRPGRSEAEPAPPPPTGPPVLQASWSGEALVVWGGGPASRPAEQSDLEELLAGAGSAGVTWEAHGEVNIPGVGRSYALQAPMRS